MKGGDLGLVEGGEAVEEVEGRKMGAGGWGSYESEA